MSRLVWDKVGERLYETGIDRVVLFPFKDGAYKTGVAWNGVTAINENPSGAEPSPLYANNIKYLNLISAEEFGYTLEAYTSPEEFDVCDGTAEIATGVSIGQQPRETFGLAYRTLIGSDTEGTKKGYKIHLVYGCLASPSGKEHGTVNESPEAVSLSWEVSTTPVEVGDYQPTAHLIIDSTRVPADKLKALEELLYGTSDKESTLPLPSAVAELVGSIADNTDNG